MERINRVIAGLEKNKVLFTYDPSVHDYSEDKPELVCIGNDHWVYGNKVEIEQYKATRDAGIPMKSVSFKKPGDEEYAEETDNVSTETILDAPIHDTGSRWYSVGSFILPVFGIIGGLIFKKFKHIRNFKACMKGAIAGFCTIGAIALLFALLLLIAII